MMEMSECAIPRNHASPRYPSITIAGSILLHTVLLQLQSLPQQDVLHPQSHICLQTYDSRAHSEESWAALSTPALCFSRSRSVWSHDNFISWHSSTISKVARATSIARGYRYFLSAQPGVGISFSCCSRAQAFKLDHLGLEF
jgi:hypothetical protein